MEKPHVYNLGRLPRLFRYPYPLDAVGWMPHHICVHRDRVIAGAFVCLSTNAESPSATEINGALRSREPDPIPRFSVIRPGTVLNTVRPSYHDELFFHYDDSCADSVLAFLAPEMGGETEFLFPGFPEEIVAEIRRELHDPEFPGAADRLDQLAIRLFTEILLRRRSAVSGEPGERMRLHTIAAELVRGRELAPLLRENGFGERTFYRVWRKFFGISPREYVLRRRVEHACALLRETELAPEAIAARCGFGSAAYFYETFRRRTGTTPGRFRRAASGGPFR